MSEYLIQEETLTDIADAIRAKTGGTDAIAVSAMASAISEIASGGGGMSDEWVTISELPSAYAISVGITKYLNYPTDALACIIIAASSSDTISVLIVGDTVEYQGEALGASFSILYDGDDRYVSIHSDAPETSYGLNYGKAKIIY